MLHMLITSYRSMLRIALIFIFVLIVAFRMNRPALIAQTDSSYEGTLQTDTFWTPQQSPYRVTDELIVPTGVTLTIMAGAIVHFDTDARIVIQGRLIAEGTEMMPIAFTGGLDRHHWRGLQFDQTMEDNRIRYAVLEDARTDDGMIGLENSRVLIEYVTFDHCTRRRIRTLDSSLIVRRCSFENIFGPDEPPSTDNLSEHIWGSGIPDNGYFIIEKNIFGTSKGHNDAIDFDGPARPNPIPHIRNNIFLGGGDDALDFECDAVIEGNTFMNFVRDTYNKASGETNILSAGAEKYYELSHNVFINSQHIVQVKNDAFVTFANNTAVNISGAAIYFDLGLPGRKPGHGAYIENCIFWHTPIVLEGIADDTEVSANYCLLPTQWHHLGTGNMDADPCFADPGHWVKVNGPDQITEPNDPNAVWVDGDYHLKSRAGRWDFISESWIQDEVTSPCIDAGDPNSPIGMEPFPNGGIINMGAYGGTTEASKSYFGKPVCETIVSGDINGDCEVDFVDFAIMTLHWLQGDTLIRAMTEKDL